MKKIFKPFCDFYYFTKDKIKRSIRLELVVTFCICLLAAFIVGTWYNGRYNEKHVISQIDYTKSVNQIVSYLTSAKRNLEKLDYDDVKGSISNIVTSPQNLDDIDKTKIDDILNNTLKKNSNTTIKLYVCNLDGTVLYKSSNVDEQKVDIYNLIGKARQFRKECENSLVIDNDNGRSKKRIVFDYNVECVDVDGINLLGQKYYLVIQGMPKRSLSFIRPHGTPASVIAAIVTFIAFFYFLTSKKMWYIEKLSQGLSQISKNNLDYRIEIQGKDELANLAGNINFMAAELKNRIEKEREAEKTKNDLITNVSHDLRTPLTSIKGYLDLVKDKKYKNEEELNSYVNISYNKSEKLELLINDLFEYTKLSNKVITLNKKRICLNELLEQLVEELYVICQQNNVVIKNNQCNKNIYATVDGDKMVRVFENLLMNAIRYTSKPGEIILKITSNEKSILVSIENKCEHISNSKLNKLFNRFYRMDKSRSESTGGSGLGLAISKSIVDLHGGEIWAESPGENIIFYVKIPKNT